MDILLIVLGALAIVAGITFSVLPPLPGPPIAWVALLLLNWHSGDKAMAFGSLILWLVIAVASTFMDNVLAVWGTKFTGGSKAGTWGSMVGLLVGLIFMGPFGILIGPFAGAVLFELGSGRAFNVAVKSGFGAFLGFLAGTLLKLGISIWIFVLWLQLLL
jgi:uncharacterized protein YqgC (DUF456 family)